MLNIFICHRPYHILRSADIIYKYYQDDDCENVLISYNLININIQHFKQGKRYPALEKRFSRVIMKERDDVSIWKLRAFNHYYYTKIKENHSMVEEFSQFDNLYFFSDLEKPIEILVGMLKESKKESANVYIVDEGIASYYRQRPVWEDLVKGCITSLFRYKYINHTANYGLSHLYTKAMASYPDKCRFRCNHIDKMLPMSTELLNDVAQECNAGIDLNSNFVLYLSSIIDISFGVKKDEEIRILTEMKTSAAQKGYKFYIKAHPVQDVHYYTSVETLKDSVVKTELPAEIFFKDTAVIASVASSSLINAELQGIKALDLSYLFGIDMKSVLLPKLRPLDLDDFERMLD